MSELISIPMFPLAILPLPGELVPLHIFEPRYRQLLQDMEESDVAFGIPFNHEINKACVGSYMRLESTIKRYSTGESDIVVKCLDLFTTDNTTRVYKDKLYPGGRVSFWHTDLEGFPSVELSELFHVYRKERNITQQLGTLSMYQIALDLNLNWNERYRFVSLPQDKRVGFLTNQIKYHLHLLGQEEKSRDTYHLN